MKQKNESSAIRCLEKGIQEMLSNLLSPPIQKMLLQDLITYLTLLMQWNKIYNLTAIRDIETMVTHHLLDSLAVVSAFQHAHRVLDVGSGGGLPGIVLALWAKRARPIMQVDLIESVRKKTAFLTQVKSTLALTQVAIHTARVEQFQCQDNFYDVITSRAFSSLSNFVRLSDHLLAENGHWIALKGRVFKDEMQALPTNWHISKIQGISVSGLPAARHLVFIDKKQPIK